MRRFPIIVRLAAILAAYIAVCIAIATILIGNMHFKNGRSVLGAQYYLGLFMAPNALSFGISIWVMRSRWVALRMHKLIAVGFSLGISALLIIFAFVLVLARFPGNSVVSESGARVLMVAPGIIAAQFLRLRDRLSKPAAPGARSEPRG
jgi:hypothetical protein